jgi:hypothetical protein
VFWDIVDASSLRSDRLLLLFVLWTLWATRSVVHKSTGLAVRLAQVESSDPVGAIVHSERAGPHRAGSRQSSPGKRA